MAKKRVALIIETSSSYGRGLLQGIVQFMRLHDQWSVFLEQRDLETKLPAWLSGWNGDGIISRATTPELADRVAETGIPFVELTDRNIDHGFAHVWSNDTKIGQLAAEHLLERGYTRFGFCGFAEEAWSERRQAAFCDAIQQAGFKTSIYNSPWHGEAALSWEDEHIQLSNWLNSIPKPFAVLTCNDLRGQHVLDACSRNKIAVPEEVAVIGVDNDEILCHLCTPPLTSVIPNAEGIGYLGAELLSKMIHGIENEQKEFLLDPIGIAMRQSTDVVAVDDPSIAAALLYIRENACQGITVDEVTEHVKVSRSKLERQIRKYLGRTPQQEIRSVQIKRARDLLINTDLSAERIAKMCGFDHPEYMHVVFKRELGITPGQFRKSETTN